jgi:hypothetical protein
MTLLVAPIEVLTDSRLTDPERRVLLALFSFRGKNTDCVWPERDKLGARAQIKDLTRISKLTTALAEKGWVTKRKRSFSQGNEYFLTVPEELANLDSEAKLDKDQPPQKPPENSKAKLDSETTLEDESNIGPDANANLDSQTNSNLDSAANPYEQTSEQTSEQAMPSTDGGRKFRMTLAWHPSESFADLCTMSGIDTERIHPATQTMIFGEFKSYWLGESDCLRQSKWEHKLLQWLIRLNGRGALYTAPGKDGSLRKRDIVDVLTDRSWAN